MRKTSAWLIVGAYVLLIIYASLFPFADWRYQGWQSWAFLWAGLPQYWTVFDVLSNLLGYVPLGFLLVIAQIRAGEASHAVRRAVIGAAVLSMGMEAVQVFLPARVPSNVDATLNVLGAWAGATLAERLNDRGWVSRWVEWRERWFLADAHIELVLMLLWPCALLFPTAIPLGLGQIWGRWTATAGADEQAAASLADDMATLAVMTPLGEVVSVTLASAAPVLLVYAVMPAQRWRPKFAAGLLGAGVMATSISMGVSLGAAQAVQWLEHGPVQLGLLMGLGVTALGRRLPTRHAAMLACALLLVYLLHINTVGSGAYFQQTLLSWQHGRFSRFHGLLEWLGWVWPYAVLAVLLQGLWQTRRTRIQT